MTFTPHPVTFGGMGNNNRMLSAYEMQLIKNVFKTAPLPRLDKITIGDGQNARGGYWTSDDYQMNLGPTLWKVELTGFGAWRATLVHEMTHVWQYFNGTLTERHAFFAHAHYSMLGKDDDLYKYDVNDDSWDDMGFEGQAQLVEDWYKAGAKTEDQRYIFIENILYTGDTKLGRLTAGELSLSFPHFQMSTR
jgi:hypothetical protein